VNHGLDEEGKYGPRVRSITSHVRNRETTAPDFGRVSQ
jgi:hypothetical protein